MAHSRLSWDDRLLFAPLDTLSARSRALVVAICTLVTLVWSAMRSHLRYAWVLPDVKFYLLMARGHYEEVPAPFSARPLAPLLAQHLARWLHGSAEGGFTVLAFASLLVALVAVFALAARSRAPRWTLLLLAAVPFWPQLLGNAGLPDPLYTALLALLLVALEWDAPFVAALLLFPLMLTRESTVLTLLCLAAVGWRRLRWSGTLLACASVVAGALVVRRLSAGSLPNPEHLSGGLYMAGKLVSNTARSLGVVPWSNVYPVLCAAPAWQHALHLGPVHSVGVCSFAAEAPLEAISALLTVFGMLPVLTVALLATSRFGFGRLSLLARFCLVYGGISFLIAPMLGTWYTRLFAYGWPLFLVALPRILEPMTGARGAAGEPVRSSPVWPLLAVLQLVVLALSPQPIAARVLLLAGLLEAVWLALFLVQRSRPAGHRLTA